MGNQTILVIEDNPINMKLVCSLLHLGRYNTLKAENAKAGIQLAKQHKPNLILMDVQLPGMDGLSATQIIKKDPVLKTIPVVALTSHAMRGYAQNAREAGCDGYISKPIDTRNFLKTISQFLIQEKKPSEKKGIYHKNRILIVDDEPLNVKVLATKLPPDEYDIIKAYSGREALEKVDKHSPDLILLDLMMPGMDGYEVTRRLKTSPETKGIPIIIVTMLDCTEDKIKALDAGVEEFISKPVNTTELLTRMKSMLRLKQYEDQLILRRQTEESFTVPISQEESIPKSRDVPLVLLVEDNERDARLFQSYLQGQPYRVALVRDGEEALSLAQGEKIDLILLDILLPGMDGFDVCRRFKEMEQTRNIQVVVITCLTDLENKLKSIEIGADDYLIKPIIRKELIVRINTLLKKKAYLDTLCSNYEIALNSAITDGLTRLYNHIYLKRFLDLEVKRSLRYRYPVSLILIDIDDFKKHNDTLGHLAGDTILRELSEVLKRNIREIDLAARYGGDEFAVALPYCGKENATIIAERIRQALALHSFPHEVRPIGNVTLCIGVVSCPIDALVIDELIQKADQMLYKAKEEGKNRVFVYN